MRKPEAALLAAWGGTEQMVTVIWVEASASRGQVEVLVVERCVLQGKVEVMVLVIVNQ